MVFSLSSSKYSPLFFQNDDLNLFFGFFGGMESRREFPKGEKDIYCDHSTKNQLTGAPSDY